MTGAPASWVTASVALIVLVLPEPQTASVPSVLTSRSSERQCVEFAVVTQLTPGSKNAIAPSDAVKKYGSVKPFSSCVFVMVVGFPGEPIGNCSDQVERSKLHPGVALGSSGPLP